MINIMKFNFPAMKLLYYRKIFSSCLTGCMTRGGARKFIEVTRSGVRKLIELIRGVDKKIYWPEGTIFGLNHAFFILRGRIHGKFLILTTKGGG